jgi:hypothetical protein
MSWFSPRDPSDPQGDLLASVLEPSDLCVLNSNSPTCLPPNNSPSSSPDISLASAHLLPSLSWSVLTRLNSDHLPIIVSYLSDFQPPRLCRSFTNFKLANWAGFVRESEDLISCQAPPSFCSKGEHILRDILVTASKHNIPSGYRKYFVPGLPILAKSLISERDELRAQDPAIPILQAQIDNSIKASSRQAWREEAESSSMKNNPSKCWSLF